MRYLKVWTSFREIMEMLSDDEKGRLFDAMLKYAEDGEIPELTGNERFVWPTAKQNIDRTAENNEKLRENSMKAVEAKKAKHNQDEPTETKANQTQPNETKDIQTQPIKEKEKKSNDKEILSNESTKKAVNRFTPPTEEEVQRYCMERNNGINPQSFVDFYASKGWKVGNTPMKDWKACVRTWERRDNEKPTYAPKVNAQNYHQRSYTEEQLRSSAADDLLREAERLSREGVV